MGAALGAACRVSRVSGVSRYARESELLGMAGRQANVSGVSLSFLFYIERKEEKE